MDKKKAKKISRRESSENEQSLTNTSEDDSKKPTKKKTACQNDEDEEDDEIIETKQRQKKKKNKKGKSESDGEEEEDKPKKTQKSKKKMERSDNSPSEKEEKPKKTQKKKKNHNSSSPSEDEEKSNPNKTESESCSSEKEEKTKKTQSKAKKSGEEIRSENNLKGGKPGKNSKPTPQMKTNSQKNNSKNKRNEEDEEESKSNEQTTRKKANTESKYDLIVDIDSIMAANQGWEVIFKNQKTVEKAFETEQISVGIVGRENVGKTYIINKICGESFPSGYYSKTKGLSLKYCMLPQQQMKVLMDSAGMNAAIFFYNLEEFLKYYKKKVENNSIPKEEYDRLRGTMINDRSISEYFIQNFILFSCNILIIVVEQLSQNDQKIIERIRNIYFGLKTIIIIHNYFKLQKKEHVIEQAKYEIQGAFNSKEQIIPNSDYVPYFIEITTKKDTKNIYHLILGKENADSGDFFNETTLKYLSSVIETEVNISKFNIFDKINKYWSEKHRIYTNSFVNDEKLPQFQLVKTDKGIICRLNTEKEIVLKTPEFNVLGSLQELDLVYHIYVKKDPKREKVYYFEIPGNANKPEMTLKKTKDGDQILTLKIIKDKKIPKGYECIEGGFEEGVFEKKIKINDQFGDYKNNPDFTKYNKGILELLFILEDEEKQL